MASPCSEESSCRLSAYDECSHEVMLWREAYVSQTVRAPLHAAQQMCRSAYVEHIYTFDDAHSKRPSAGTVALSVYLLDVGLASGNVLQALRDAGQHAYLPNVAFKLAAKVEEMDSHVPSFSVTISSTADWPLLRHVEQSLLSASEFRLHVPTAVSYLPHFVSTAAGALCRAETTGCYDEHSGWAAVPPRTSTPAPLDQLHVDTDTVHMCAPPLSPIEQRAVVAAPPSGCSSVCNDWRRDSSSLADETGVLAALLDATFPCPVDVLAALRSQCTWAGSPQWTQCAVDAVLAACNGLFRLMSIDDQYREQCAPYPCATSVSIVLTVVEQLLAPSPPPMTWRSLVAPHLVHDERFGAAVLQSLYLAKRVYNSAAKGKVYESRSVLDTPPYTPRKARGGAAAVSPSGSEASATTDTQQQQEEQYYSRTGRPIRRVRLRESLRFSPSPLVAKRRR